MITSDPDEAARAPMGDALVGDVALALDELVERVSASDRPPPDPRPSPATPDDSSPATPDDTSPATPKDSSRLTPARVFATLRDALGEEGIVALESPSNTLAFRDQVRPSRPGSFYFGAGGGLGFGLSAAVGVQLAQPDRPVVAAVGEGSAQYTITALWTALAHSVPLTVLVLRNDEYAILKWFSDLEGVKGAPGLDLPGIDCVSLARGYGLRARRVENADDLHGALSEATGSSEPELIEVPITPGMSV
jgi:benzoylformate decarboxylase